jgi:two-component system sensor histidine kinase PilS (NtrC family)
MESNRKIAPCPLSKRYLIDEDHAWHSLTVFFLYRLTVGSILVFLFFLGVLPSSLGKFSPSLYATAAPAYLILVFVAAPAMFLRRPSFTWQAQFQLLVDMSLIPVVMHASGGVASGVGVLLGLSVAAGGLLIGGRCAPIFAGLASLGVLTEELYADYFNLFDQTHYAYAAMLGACYFGIAFVALALAQRAEQSEAIAEQRSADIANLQQINEFVIQHLQSGILVVDKHGRIRMSNESATRMIPELSGRHSLESVSAYLWRSFHDWLADPLKETAVLKNDGTTPIHVRFSRLGQSKPPIHMIFLEDSAVYRERVQHSKLASLARLTAGIAHEIRNPLGAISHACQLMAEGANPEGEDRRKDRRLVSIILEHSARLNTIIQNILEISRRGEAKRERVELESVLTKFLQDFQLRQGIESGGFRLDLKIENPRVLVDLNHFRQILENLCSNSWKYGNRQLGPIILRVRNRHGAICIEFLDHATPIDPAVVQNLFEPFFTTSTSGTGLGLYISRELAELNHGKLEYSDLGEGSCFRLYLSDADKTVVGS